MKCNIIFLIMFIFSTSFGLYASDSFEAPLPPGGVKQALQETNSITLQYKSMSREDITNFYKN